MTISTLAEVIAPATVSDLRTVLRERRLSFRRAESMERYSGLIDWPALRGIVGSGVVHSNQLRVTRNGVVLHRLMYSDDGKVNAQRLDGLIAQGISIVINKLEIYAPAVATLCDDMRAQFQNEIIDLVSVLTSGPGGAFKLHNDACDGLVMQIEGAKRWRVYGSPVSYPVIRMPKSLPPETPPIFDEVLRPGDLLVLPSGYWHHCDNASEISLHVTCTIQPRVALDVLRDIVGRLADEELFRLPLLRMDTQQRAQHETALKSRLVDVIAQTSFCDAAARLSDDVGRNEEK